MTQGGSESSLERGAFLYKAAAPGQTSQIPKQTNVCWQGVLEITWKFEISNLVRVQPNVHIQISEFLFQCPKRTLKKCGEAV